MKRYAAVTKTTQIADKQSETLREAVGQRSLMTESRIVITRFASVPNIEDIKKDLEATLLKEFGGFLAYSAKGGWRDDNGNPDSHQYT